MARKTEVYSWRLSPATKAGLEETARSQRRTVAQLLDEMVAERLGAGDLEQGSEQDRQRRLHARAARFAGRIAGRDPRRSEKVRELVRARLTGRRGGAH